MWTYLTPWMETDGAHTGTVACTAIRTCAAPNALVARRKNSRQLEPIQFNYSAEDAGHTCAHRRRARGEGYLRCAHAPISRTLFCFLPLGSAELSQRDGFPRLAGAARGPHAAGGSAAGQPREANELRGFCKLDRRAPRSGRAAHRLRHWPGQRLERRRTQPRAVVAVLRTDDDGPCAGSRCAGRAA